MKQEEKQLLLEDLCARLPYGVKIMFSSNGFRWDREQTLEAISQCEDGEYAINGWGIHGIKPYLRLMSSMTEEEKEELVDFGLAYLDSGKHIDEDGNTIIYSGKKIQLIPDIETYDWLNRHHFDYRNLIEKGLAIEVNESNNPYGK